MSLVLLTADGLEHRYVANRLDQSVGLDAIIVDTGVTEPRLDRLRRLRQRYSASELVSRGAYNMLRIAMRDVSTRRRGVTEVLGGESAQINRPEIVRRVSGLNNRKCWNILEELAPDRILVYGTGIVGRTALGMSSCTPLNMHTGISPYYRGSSCAFWPLYNRQLDRLGATVHEVTAEVDGGRIYATAPASLDPGDDVHRVFARCVAVGADLYVDVLQRLAAGTIEAVPQDLSLGREYRAAMRGPIAELRVRWAIRRGLVREHCLLE